MDEAIAALPEKLRYPVIAHFLESRTHGAIAQTLDLSQSAVTRRIQKGIEQVRKSLKRRGVTVGTSALAAMLATHAVEAAPVALASSLGKIALAGAGTRVAAAGGGLVGGLAAMKLKVAILAVLVALLAGVGTYVALQGRGSSETHTVASQPKPSVMLPAETQAPEIGTAAGPANMASEAVSEETFDADLNNAFVKAQVEMLFPHTDEEYEQWARQEYPHIMWLYDILTKPEYGINWQPGPIERFEESNWYHGPFTDASLGWRKLLIESAEIFKFDWPMRLDDPNCIPSIKATQAAAAVEGFSMELSDDGKWELPNLDFAEKSVPARQFDLTVVPPEGPTSIPDQELPEGYIEHLAADPDLTKTVLVYLSGSIGLINTPEFDDISDSAKELLTQLCAIDSTECNVSTWMNRLSGFFDSRAELISFCPETGVAC